MVKHTQAIRWQQPMTYLSVFDHFVGLALKGLKFEKFITCKWGNNLLTGKHVFKGDQKGILARKRLNRPKVLPLPHGLFEGH